jgi:hypothetical protein
MGDADLVFAVVAMAGREVDLGRPQKPRLVR